MMTAMGGWRLALAMAVALLAGCGGAGDVAVPRPQGYPRIELYPPVYTVAVPVAGLSMEINVGACVDTVRTGDRSQWFNIEYPRYDAAIYCTYTLVDRGSVAGVIDNRRERMALNSGGAPGELISVENKSGVSGQLLVTPSGAMNPVQFLATDGHRFVLSGAMAFIGDSVVDTDSVAPVIEAVGDDMIRMLQSMSWNQ